MADNSVADIGTGRALSGVYPNYAGDIFKLRATLSREGKQQKEQKLLTPEDFKVDNKDLHPLFAHQIAQAQTDYGNQWNDLKNKIGEQKANYQMSLLRPQFQERINNIQAANANLLAAEKDGILFPNKEKYLAAANNAATTGDQWAALNDDQMGITTTPTFGFNMPMIKESNLTGVAGQFKKPEFENVIPGKVTTQGDRQSQAFTHIATPQTVDNTVDAIMGDVNHLATFRANYRDEINKYHKGALDLSDPQHADKLRSAVQDWAMAQFSPRTSYQTTNVPRPPRETEFDKKQSFVNSSYDKLLSDGIIQKDVAADRPEIIKNGDVQEHGMFSPTTIDDKLTFKTKTVPLRMDLVNKGTIPILMGSDIYDLQTGKHIKADESTLESGGLKTDHSTVEDLDGTGKKKWLIGNISYAIPDPDDDKKTIKKNATVAVPYDNYKNDLRAMGNPIKAFDEGAANIISGSGKQQSSARANSAATQTFNVNGKTYNIPEDKVSDFKAHFKIK